jgi:hypothetical protein
MRPTLRFLLTLCVLSATLRADESVPEESENIYDPFYGAPAPLASAFRLFARDANRWAYTQHSKQYDGKGRVKEERVVRYDPSQHYDVQWTLLLKDGEPATEGEVKRHRRQMAKRSKERRTLGELLRIKEATLVQETEQDLIYEVPLQFEEGFRFSPDKFQVFVTVGREGPTLRALEVKLRSSLRVAGVVKVKSGEAEILFGRVLPPHGPAITRMEVEGSGSVLFVPMSSRAEATRTDFKRVTPYDDRFTVKPGPLKMIDF